MSEVDESASREVLRADRQRRARRRRRLRQVATALLITVSAVLCVGLIVVTQIKAQADVAVAERENRGFTPPPLPTPTLGTGTDQIVVIGDEWASPRNTVENRPWTLRLQSATGIRVRALASQGGAYVDSSVGAGGAPFSSGSAAVPPSATLIVFFGGVRDADDSGVDLAASATQALADASRRAPDARIVVVGPVPRRLGTAAELKNVRSVLQTVARTANATWIDPVQQQWLDAARYYDGKQEAPSSAGNERLATEMQAALRPFLSTATTAPNG